MHCFLCFLDDEKINAEVPVCEYQGSSDWMTKLKQTETSPTLNTEYLKNLDQSHLVPDILKDLLTPRKSCAISSALLWV